MIGAILQYARDEALPRWARILWQPQVVGAIALGVLTSMYGTKWPLAGLKISDATTMLLTYAAIAFGFCIAGMALVLTLPNESFVSLLMKHKLGRNKQSSYSDLLFVFSWTAIVHWTEVVLAIVAVCVRGGDRTVLNVRDGLGWKVMIGSLAGLSMYALIQFLMTVITLSEVGRLYIREFPSQRRQG
jgi:hypothetical protein